jgi:hypothetical protein
VPFSARTTVGFLYVSLNIVRSLVDSPWHNVEPVGVPDWRQFVFTAGCGQIASLDTVAAPTLSQIVRKGSASVFPTRTGGPPLPGYGLRRGSVLSAIGDGHRGRSSHGSQSVPCRRRRVSGSATAQQGEDTYPPTSGAIDCVVDEPQIDEQLRRYPLRRARCGWMDERVPPTASGRVCARTSGAALPCAPWDTHRHTTSSSQAWPHSSSIDKGPVPDLSVPWATDSDLSPCFLSGRNKPLQYWVHGVLLHAGVRRPGRGHGGLLRRHGAARVLGDEARVFDRAVQPVDNFRGLNGPAYLMVASGSVWCVAAVFVLIAPLYTSRIRDSGCGPTGGPGRRPRLESRPRPRRNLGTGTYCGCFFFPFFSLVL